MRRSPLPLVLFLVALLVAPPVVAEAAPKRSTKERLKRSKHLWATINVCDTRRHPNTIGIRASMPASGKRLALFMRFRVQYLAAADRRWHNIARNADSRPRHVGALRRGVRQAGFSFSYKAPAGGAHTLRGAVTFEWRSGTRVVYRIRELTRDGHRSSTGADPPRFSAGVCRIR